MDSFKEITFRVQEVLERNLSVSTSSILEAGCGSASNIDISEFQKKSGIDISRSQLEKNTIVQRKYHGDIQAYEFREEKFDAIVCWDVLEHVASPRKALHNFDSWLRKGGLLIIAAPEPKSIKGLLTKMSPFFIHAIVYKKLYELNATPFPTFLRFAMSHGNVEKFFSQRGYEMLMNEKYPPFYALGKLRARKLLWLAYQTADVLTLNKFRQSEYVLVLRKPRD